MGQINLQDLVTDRQQKKGFKNTICGIFSSPIHNMSVLIFFGKQRHPVPEELYMLLNVC